MSDATDQLGLSVVVLEGVGRKAATQLKRAGIYVVADFLRANPGSIHATLPSRVSVDKVRAWAQAATLLQVQGMTPRWAGVLQRAGIGTLEDLSRQDLAGLRRVFRSARRAGQTDGVPSTAQMCAMLQDAAVLACSGAMNGTVLGADDRPVRRAVVRAGRIEAKTDERGRFRLTRIPLWGTSTLVVKHPQYQLGRFRLSSVQPSHVIDSQAFKMRSAGAGASKPRVLMEVRGDTLPPLGPNPPSARVVKREQLVDGELLAIVEFSSDRARVKLVSKLLVYDEGRFFLPYAWFGTSEVGSKAKPGDWYALSGGAIRPVRASPMILKGWREMLRTRRRMGKDRSATNFPQNPHPRDADRWLKQMVEALNRARKPQPR